MTVPASVATGEYNMEISVRGQSFTLKKELTVAVPGTEKVFKYGSYEFTALKSYKDSLRRNGSFRQRHHERMAALQGRCHRYG